MPSRSKGRTPVRPHKPDDATKPQQDDQCMWFEGERLSLLLNSVRKEIESERASNQVLPEKLWFKQHFAIGVNEVTRVLERMPASMNQFAAEAETSAGSLSILHPQDQSPYPSTTRLQGVIIASDCQPRLIIKHLPGLASSRCVPVIYVKDKKEGSLRLGELMKLKTAVAVGIRAKGNSINQLLEKIMQGGEFNSGTGDAWIQPR